MNTAEGIWNKLSKSKKYREEFALAFLKRSVAFQIKALRKKHCGSQVVLAERSKLTQGVVSRAEDQDYGNLTFNTAARIAGGLDMAFIGRFVSFSDLVRFSLELSEDEFIRVPTFTQEENQLLCSQTETPKVQEQPTELGKMPELDTDQAHRLTQGGAVQKVLGFNVESIESGRKRSGPCEDAILAAAIGA
ncbi:MAG: hypothetical protein ACRD2B_13560 [Terriglobia bacterium]